MTVDHWRDYEYDADLDAAAARMTAAKQSGVISTHTEPERAPTAPQRPSEDELRAQQWAHLRKYYVNGRPTMKPLKLEVFPLLSAEDRKMVYLNLAYQNPHGAYAGLDWKYVPGVAGIYSKRLTPAEIAAEYHQQDAYNAYWIDRATIAAVRRNEDRLATLHRFATLPSYDKEIP